MDAKLAIMEKKNSWTKSIYSMHEIQSTFPSTQTKRATSLLLFHDGDAWNQTFIDYYDERTTRVLLLPIGHTYPYI